MKSKILLSKLTELNELAHFSVIYNMKKFAILAFVLMFFTQSAIAQRGVVSNDPEAEKWLSHLYKKYKTTPYSLDYKMTVSGDQVKTESYSGSYTAQGVQYFLKGKDVSTIYNGKTMWSIQHTDKEVLVSESGSGKNKNKISTPMDVISKYKKNFKYRVKGKKGSVLTIELVPKSKYNSYFKIDLSVNTTNSKIVSAKIYEKSGMRVRYSVTNLKSYKSMPSSTFVFDKSQYQGYNILDLR